MFWSTININTMALNFLPMDMRIRQFVCFGEVFLSPLQSIVNETLYKMQHNGSKIYLEKVLNEAYNIAGYNPQAHEETKQIYIEDVEQLPSLYVWQDAEEPNTFIEDDGDDSVNDLFLEEDGINGSEASWTIFVPASISFQEFQMRALVDSYRYIGKRYNIEIY